MSDILKLLEENTRLNAEINLRKAERVHDLNQIGGLQEELARLLMGSFVTAVPVEQYERVIKAGDELAKRTEFFQKRWDADELCQEVEAWNAAKEGKPTEEKSPSFIEDLGNGVEKHDLLFRVPPAKEGKSV